MDNITKNIIIKCNQRIKEDCNNTSAYCEKAFTLQENKQYKEALDIYRYLTYSSNHKIVIKFAYYCIGKIMQKLGHDEQAKIAFNRS